MQFSMTRLGSRTSTTRHTCFSEPQYVPDVTLELPFLTGSLQDDLMGLDFSKGECRNASVPQNVTFGYQVCNRFQTV
jgi:hypothetical protein